MDRKRKSKLAIGALVIGGLAFLDGSILLGYSPGTFIFAAAFAIVAALLGLAWVRIAGICVFVASIAMGIHHYEQKQHIDALLKIVRERAETNSVSK